MLIYELEYIPLLAGDGHKGGTVSTFEELIIVGVMALVASVSLTSLVDDCLQSNN